MGYFIRDVYGLDQVDTVARLGALPVLGFFAFGSFANIPVSRIFRDTIADTLVKPYLGLRVNSELPNLISILVAFIF